MNRLLLLCMAPLFSMADGVRVPGTWTLMPTSTEAVPVVPPAVPISFSGQRATLPQSEVRVPDGAEVKELKDFSGLLIDRGEIELVYEKAVSLKEAENFVKMATPPVAGAEWYGSTFWTGNEAWARIGKDWMHPGSAGDVARVFSAPKDGQVIVSGAAKKLHLDGDGVKVSLCQNAKEVWSAELDGKDAIGKEPLLKLELKKDDALRFTINRRGTYTCDTTGWDPVVTYEGGASYRASEGFGNKQGASGWYYESSSQAKGKTTRPEIYGVGTDFRLFKGHVDSATAFPVVIVSDGNPQDGFGGYVLALDTDSAWSLTQDERGLKISGGPAAIVVRYDGTWIEGLKVLAKLSSTNTPVAALGASVRAAYQKAVAGVSRAPELDLFLLAVSEWVQDDLLFNGGDEKLLAACVADQLKRLEQLTGTTGAQTEPGWTGYLRTRLRKRSALLSNPLLGSNKILFSTRKNPSWNHEVAQYFGWRQRPGGSLYVLDHPGISMSCMDLVQKQLPQGSFLEPRLSYDAKKILFSYVITDGALDPRTLPRNDADTNHHYYHLYQIHCDGTGLRQLTNERYDDLMPEWLPDGGIAFVSTRRQASSRCFWWGYSDRWHSYTMFRMDPDGSTIQQLSWNDVNEWFPAVSNSGHLLFARWDYIDRDAVTHQNLWSMRPDGTNPMAVWGNEVPKPHCTFQAKPIPNSSKIICVASAHHAITGGPIILIDPTIHNNSLEAITHVTPGHFPEAEHGPHGEWYNSPWALSERLYLVAYSRDPLKYEPARHNPDYALGLYAMDDRGNRELLYRDGTIGATCPTLLVPRTVPPELPSVNNPLLAKRGLGEVFLSDVYEGLPKAKRGTLKQVRVVQVFPKTTRDSNAPRIGVAGEENTRAVLGVTPVEADGSARFLVPAGKPILFQVLDEEGFAYQTMRSSTSLMPGERVSCVGCHENKMAVPTAATTVVAAMKRPAADLTPTPESGRPYGFVEHVQPILDAKCVRCHNDQEAKAGINLSRTIIEPNGFTASYESLCYEKKPDGKRVRRLSMKTGRPLITYFAMRNQIQVTPEGGADGARGSGLMAALKAAKEKYGLTDEDLRRIATWIDLNAVFYGVYEPAEQLALQREGKPVPMPKIQ